MWLAFRPFRRLLRLLGQLGIWCSVVSTIIDIFRWHDLNLHLQETFPTAPLPQQRIFISSTHWNNEADLRDFWNTAVLELVRFLGPGNVYVSIYESGSWDGSKDALRGLERELVQLKVGHTIVLNETTHEDELKNLKVGDENCVLSPKGYTELRRIPYLSRLRNLSLEPLQTLLTTANKTFDKILFLNDIYFSLQDFQRLLLTHGGQYAAACALDFEYPPYLYDTFAVRDIEGHGVVMHKWPYFRSHISRSAIKNALPVPVSSCFNGMMVADAEPYYNRSNPLRFRGIPDSLAAYHLEGSECCLIHADNPKMEQAGIFLNPDVRVAYSKASYDAMKTFRMGPSTYLARCWENRLRRWMTTDHALARTNQTVKRWSRNETVPKQVVYCLVDEMQVVRWNGWEHV